jgi:osmotically-inducible protein OsmY
MKTDMEIQRDVLNALQWEPSIDESQIGLTVKDGIVTLTGYVPHFPQKVAAEQAAKRVYGVKAVANDIEVRVVGAGQRTDTDIAAAAVNALKWDAMVPDERIKVTVTNGWVKLEGDVEWDYQRRAAEANVRRLIGVKGVSNLLTIRPRVRPTEVKTKIEEAFLRSAELDVRRIRVETSDGKVILRGNVRSWVEREAAEQAALAAPGVSEVENHLTVVP